MTDLTERPIVIAWLTTLAIRCAPKRTEDIELVVRTYAAPIAADVPPRVFGDDCLEFVSRQFEFFPAYAALRKQLDVWQSRNPERKAIPAPGIEMSASDRAMVGFWQQFRSGEKILPRGVSLESWLSMCRKPCPAAFRYICDTDLVAAEICVKEGWLRDHLPQPSLGEIEAVHITVSEALAGMRPARPTMPPHQTIVPEPPQGMTSAPPKPNCPDDATLLAIYERDYQRAPSSAAGVKIASLKAKIAEAARLQTIRNANPD